MKKSVKKTSMTLALLLFATIVGRLPAQSVGNPPDSLSEYNKMDKDDSWTGEDVEFPDDSISQHEVDEKKRMGKTSGQKGVYYSDSLSMHYAMIKSNLQKIISGEAKSKEEQRKSAREATKHLDKAKVEFERFKEPKSVSNEATSYRSSIKRHHEAATKQSILLNDELKITEPNQTKVKNYATAFNQAIESAEKEYMLSQGRVEK